MNGILIIDKEKGYTSRDVVNIVSKKLKTRKIGHTGTLDPIATGVLVLCIGDATKVVELLTSDDKEYIAEVTLGIETDTLDITGEIINKESKNITKEEIEKVLESYNKEYMQEVPLYSAIRVNGERLYDYAFDNVKEKKLPEELPKREVKIENIKLVSDIEYIDDLIKFSFSCKVSKGTYIRSLIRDIAQSLNTIGVMSNLRRIRQGNFKIEDAIKIDEIKDDIELTKMIDVLTKYKRVDMDSKLYFKVNNGQVLENRYNEDEILFVYNNEPIFLYKKDEKDSSKIRPWKKLSIERG